MTEELYPDVHPGDPITAKAWNRLQEHARRKDRLKAGSNINSSQGHVDIEYVDDLQPLLLRALADVLPGQPDPDAYNATLLTWDYTANRPVDAPEQADCLLKTYLLPVRNNDVVICVWSSVASAFVPALTDYVADLMVDGTSSVAHIFDGHIQLPNNSAFIDPYQSPPPAFTIGPKVWLMPALPTPDPSTGDEMIGHYTGLYSIPGGNPDVRPLFRYSAGGVTTTGGGVILRVPTIGTIGQLTAAFIQSATDGTPPTWNADGAACWAWELNGAVIQPGRYDGTYLLVHLDGKKVYMVDSGYTGTKTVCEGDGFLHTWTYARGRLITAP